MTKTLKSYRLDDRTINSIAGLKEKLSLESNSAVVRKAVKLLRVAVEAEKAGGEFLIRDSKGDRSLLL